MSRKFLDQTLDDLKNQIVALADMVADAATEAVDALLENDIEKSKKIYLSDKEINAQRFKIENECLIAIATQQPLATDLRELASMLEIVTELERMGDYAKGIAKVNLQIEKRSTKAKVILHLREMTDITVDMMRRAIKAFVEVDVETARKLPNEDDKVDELFNQIYTGLIQDMMEKKKRIELASHLQWAAHNVERMADRVVNICERTIFVSTGEMNELEESDDEWVIDIES
ncbi:MAG: phosphate signaling complex protein PhoU [Anaerolineales bacterium]